MLSRRLKITTGPTKASPARHHSAASPSTDAVRRLKMPPTVPPPPPRQPHNRRQLHVAPVAQPRGCQAVEPPAMTGRSQRVFRAQLFGRGWNEPASRPRLVGGRLTLVTVNRSLGRGGGGAERWNQGEGKRAGCQDREAQHTMPGRF